MEGLYCNFNDLQIDDLKKKLHSKIHWLLIYKEADDCEYFEDYFNNLLKYIFALNNIFNKNAVIIDLLATLQMAYDETLRQDFNFKIFRKHVLDAHNIVDKM